MNRSDSENPDLNDVDSYPIEDTEVVEQAVDNLSPVDDIELPAGEDVAITELAPDEVLVPDMDTAEPIIEVQEPVLVVTPPTFWQRLQRMFVSSPTDTAARLTQLTRAIEDSPEAAVNYVLRGEVYMDMREYALAHADFQRGYEVAEAHFEIADWGLLDQAMRDRALAGLDKAQRRLR